MASSHPFAGLWNKQMEWRKTHGRPLIGKLSGSIIKFMHGEETEHPKEQPAAKQVLRDDFESNCLEKKKRRKRQKRKMKKIF